MATGDHPALSKLNPTTEDLVAILRESNALLRKLEANTGLLVENYQRANERLTGHDTQLATLEKRLLDVEKNTEDCVSCPHHFGRDCDGQVTPVTETPSLEGER